MKYFEHYVRNRKTCEYYYIVPLEIKYLNMTSTIDVNTVNIFGIKSFAAFPLAFSKNILCCNSYVTCFNLKNK